MLICLALCEAASGRVIWWLQQGRPMEQQGCEMRISFYCNYLPIFPELSLLLWHAPSFVLLTVQTDIKAASHLTFVQDSVGRFVSRQGLFAEVLVRLGKALHLCKACVERHGRMTGVLRHVEVSCPSQLLLYHERLLQQLEDRTTETML